MDLMAEIASDEVLDLAYQWLCKQRRDRHANHDVWDVRWRTATTSYRSAAIVNQGNGPQLQDLVIAPAVMLDS
jgi:hypothetical protein